MPVYARHPLSIDRSYSVNNPEVLSIQAVVVQIAHTANQEVVSFICYSVYLRNALSAPVGLKSPAFLFLIHSITNVSIIRIVSCRRIHIVFPIFFFLFLKWMSSSSHAIASVRLYNGAQRRLELNANSSIVTFLQHCENKLKSSWRNSVELCCSLN